jgi:hypothetical protein
MSPTLRAVVLIAIILAFLTIVIMQFNQFTFAGDISKECREKKPWIKPTYSFSECPTDWTIYHCLIGRTIRNHDAVEAFDKKCLDKKTGGLKGNNTYD